jgi:hypothetical protein
MTSLDPNTWAKTWVVLYPGTVLCPSCTSVMHRADHFLSNKPAPERIMMKCLNGQCLEKGVRKWIPLQRLDVELYHAEPVDD